MVHTARPRLVLASGGSVDAGTDPLAIALEELRLRCVLMDAHACAGPWTRAFPGDTASLHVVLDGGCMIDADLQLWRYRLDPGEVLVVNRGVRGALRATTEANPPTVLSARVHLEAPLPHPMVEALPALIRANAGVIPRSFRPTLHALREELAIPTLGGAVVTTRLCEVLFVQSLRAHIRNDLSWTDQGWFRMLADPVLREHLAEAARPGATVSSLANVLGRTRQRTRVRVAQFGGTSPSALLRQARVRRAAELLRAGDTDLTRIARESGFGSRQALCRAFRRELAISPAAQWRALHHRPFPRRGPAVAADQAAVAAATGSSCADSADSRFINGSSPKEMTAPATATAPSQK
jgi:AraC-like DNA-binding protein